MWTYYHKRREPLYVRTKDTELLSHNELAQLWKYYSQKEIVSGFVLVAQRSSNMLVYLRDGSAQRSLRAATLR